MEFKIGDKVKVIYPEEHIQDRFGGRVGEIINISGTKKNYIEIYFPCLGEDRDLGSTSFIFMPTSLELIKVNYTSMESREPKIGDRIQMKASLGEYSCKIGTITNIKYTLSSSGAIYSILIPDLDKLNHYTFYRHRFEVISKLNYHYGI